VDDEFVAIEVAAKRELRAEHLGLLGLVLVVIALPAIVALQFAPHLNVFPWIYGAIAAICVGVTGNRQLMAIAVVAVPLLAGAAVLLHPHPVAAGVFFGCVVAASGLAARKRLENQVRMVPINLSIMLTFPPHDGLGHGRRTDALVIMAISLVAMLWTLALVVRPVLKRVPPISPPPDRTNRVADVYAVIAGISCGIAAWATLAVWPGIAGAWLLITMVAIIQPDFDGAFGRGTQRVLGTLLGILAAIVLGVVATNAVADVMIGTVLMVVAIHLLLIARRPYWMGIAVLTPAVVLINTPGHTVLSISLDRLAFTLLGVGLAVPLTLLVARLGRPPDGPTADRPVAA
jgi:hypothetical protein